MSLSYCIQKPFLSSVIIGSTTINQLKEIFNSINIELSQKIIDEIDSVHLENSNPTYYREFRLFDYLNNALKLILDGKFLDFYTKSVKLVKRIINYN